MILLKAPFSGGSLGKNKGTELAPDKIVERIKKFYLNEEGRLPVFNIKDIKTNESNIEETNKNIFNAVKKKHKGNKQAPSVRRRSFYNFLWIQGFCRRI